MARVIDISEGERLSLERAVRANDRVRITRLAEAGPPVEPLPMLWPCPAAPQIPAAHDQLLSPGPVEVVFLRDAVLTGPGAQPRLDDAYVAPASAFPFYVGCFIRDELAGHLWRDKRATRPRRVAAAVSLVNFNLVYGHWLTEMFPKLFVIRRLAEQGISAPIALPSTAPKWLTAMVRDTLPGQAIVTYDPEREHLEVGTLILPGMLNDAYAFHPWLAEEIERHVDERMALAPAARLANAWRRKHRPRSARAERLFVSRRNAASHFRTLLNEDELEAIAAEYGFQAVEPQRMTWRDQVATFGRARTIVGQYGSAMHNSLFAPEGAAVMCLNWIVEVQSRICNFRRQPVGYLLAEDGAKLFSLEGGHAEYRIDPRAFRERLERTLESAAA